MNTERIIFIQAYSNQIRAIAAAAYRRNAKGETLTAKIRAPAVSMACPRCFIVDLRVLT